MKRRTYFDGSRWRFMIGNEEYCGPTVDRLAAYENTGLEPEEIKALIPSSNAPLTLDELREMDGEPVWIERLCSESSDDGEWGLVDSKHDLCKVLEEFAQFELCGLTWLAYRRKPEEGT